MFCDASSSCDGGAGEEYDIEDDTLDVYREFKFAILEGDSNSGNDDSSSAVLQQGSRSSGGDTESFQPRHEKQSRHLFN